MLAAEAYGSDGNICADKNSCITLILKSDPWLFEDGGLVPADRGDGQWPESTWPKTVSFERQFGVRKVLYYKSRFNMGQESKI